MRDLIDRSGTQPVALTAARHELEDILDDLGADEVRVLARIAQRLHRGAEAYGELEIAFDRRDFRKKEARGVLMAAYAPRPWPAQLQRELGRLTGVVVRLASAGRDWPDGRPAQDVLEVRVAAQLDLALETAGHEVLAAYRTSARALVRAALAAYASARKLTFPAAWRRA